jgi:hypothetical protein
MLERPDRAALLRWLVSPQVVRPSGEVMSWHGPGAFAYPEAGGLVLRLLAQERMARGCADAIHEWLVHRVETDDVGRAGARYTFDLGIVLAGILAHAMADPPPRDRAWIDGFDRLFEAVELERALVGDASPRWSTRFGPHLRKLASCLSPLAGVGPARIPEVARRLFHSTGGGAFDPRASTPGADATYLHACSYALEGTLLLARWQGDTTPVHEAAAWLARLQRTHGGMPAWADGERGFGPTRADTTAQAVRLWAWLEPHAYAGEIARGLDWLARATMPGGGVRYGDDCDHQNTWATVFTIQALDFAEGRVDATLLL